MAGYEPWKHPDDFLYHYTSTSGLIGILSNEVIWLTNAGFLNDIEELSYGAKMMAESLREGAELELETRSGDPNTEYVADSLRSIAKSLVLFQQENPIGIEFPFVSCFSRERDDLSQWRGYASGGYCVVFHRDSLKSSMIPVGGTLGISQNIPMLQDVEYGETASDLIEQHISSLTAYLRDRGPGAAPEGVDYYFLIRQILLPGLIRIKHPAFLQENEVRMYSIDPGDVKFRASALGPVPFTEVKFEKNAIAEIIAAPGEHQPRRVRAAEALLTSCGYHSVQASASSAPFAG